ncbi:GDSL esterase/lipase At1g29670-like isoform X1 [Vicia villosa]|uniref:GDSL esterase/lipase At1g29670-like isoform X1 n=1 Tax=Vicia villosa TaxID=3911 RepID=UPI00273C406E|nr:GDSL esterase/lipase At1g29670-like isoform X1 [Vicia villosa]
MASETKTWLALYLVLLAACYMQHCVSSSQVPCLFIFGDSFSDSGNNNYIQTTANANYRPYGIDLPGEPTGRATNGRTRIDIIGQLLGFENLIPPYANTTGYDILKGVNYASISSGILDETGKKTAGTNIALGLQIQNHKIIVSKVVAKLGGLAQATDYLSKCLYYVFIGTNDYSLNYFQPQYYPTNSIYNPEDYAQFLINHLSAYLHDLHKNEARKLVLVGLDKIGCSPLAIADQAKLDGSCDEKQCVEKQNAAALIFNQKLKNLTEQINYHIRYSKTIFINSTAIALDKSVGFIVTNVSCCPTKANGFCFPNSIACTDRNEYVYFDGIHTTEAVNNLLALASYNSASYPGVAYPIDINQLAQYITGKETYSE